MDVKDEKSKCCSEVIDEDKEEIISDNAKDAEVTSVGRYRCRDCGMFFETLEAHDKHHRKVHIQLKAHPSPSMTA